MELCWRLERHRFHGWDKSNIKNMLLRKVQSSSTVINTPKQFAKFAISTICMYVGNDSLLENPDHVREWTPIPDAIWTHKVVRTSSSQVVPCKKFFSTWVNVRNAITINGTVLFQVPQKMKLMTMLPLSETVLWSEWKVASVSGLPEMVSRRVLLSLRKQFLLHSYHRNLLFSGFSWCAVWGVESPTKFLKRVGGGGLTGPPLLEEGCWERGGDFFHGGGGVAIFKQKIN